MSYHDQLISEINATLDQMAEAGDTWDPRWIAHHICSNHMGGLAVNDDADFWRHCGYRTCRDEVRRAINRRADDKPDAEDRQLRLPGWDHLQAYYVVRRDDQDVGVPVDTMTDEELEAKASQQRTMGAACYAHADELDRYRRLRQAAAAE